ncbi:MAG TPA: biopolymer transporter ExbD [Kofleriaceae bacterium]|nr:biopolymer transporter ExbD [Kofleriaceae bacterium]
MAGSSLYQDDDTSGIVDINVTPFVDVALVLLVVFMVTARLFVARGVVVEKPKEKTGGEVPATLRVTVTQDGKIYVNGDSYPTDAQAVARIEEIAAASPEPKAIIAGDRRTAYGGVMHAIELCEEAKVTAIALENEQP